MKMFRMEKLAFSLAALLAVPGRAQTPTSMDAIGQRLERLEQQNAELLSEVRLLRQELESLKASGGAAHESARALNPEAAAPESERLERLEERVDLQEGRLNEQDAVKVESTQRVPVRLTGMALFNAFKDTSHGGGADNPVVASPAPGPINAGATLRQSVIGLEFDGPEAIAGAKIRGSFLMDLFAGTSGILGSQARLRTASIEARWETRGFLVGQEKPIFSPREPNSLAQVGTSPLTAAGNLWLWRPQIRFEQRVELGRKTDLMARLGVFETGENGAALDPQFAPTLEQRRPALQGRFQLAHRFDENRRIEIAPGFHVSTTHVAASSVPSNVVSVDWFVNPIRRLEFTGELFTGKNLANLGGGGVRQGFTILALQPGRLQVIPVRSRGGWAQFTFVATPRLSFNLYGGEDDPNNRDLAAGGIARNLSYAANVFYKLAPNVVVGGEVSQVRTQFLNGQRPLNNHYDLAVAYLF